MLISKHNISSFKKGIIAFFLIIFLSIFCFYSFGQVKLKVSKNECVLKLKFINKGKESVLIPNINLRKDSVNGYMVLKDSYVNLESSDSLIIRLSTHVETIERNKIGLSQLNGNPVITITYSDIRLKKKNIQFARLPDRYCRSHPKFLVLYYKDLLLGFCLLINKPQ